MIREPKNMEEALALIQTLRNRERRHFLNMVTAKARVYDLLYEGKPEPKSVELKDRIVYLTEQLSRAIRERDEARRGKSHTEVLSGRDYSG